jgi:short-subunit dehydrogenase
MSSFQGKNILITGGANGIGRLLGIKSVQEGAKQLVVWDIDEQAMKSLEKVCENNSWRCHCYNVNLENPPEIETTAGEVLQKVGTIDMLINNAGVVTGKKFQDHDSREIHRTLAINIEAVMLTAKAFLPAMLSQNSGHIVNISSASAHIGNPNMSVYAASKWAVSGWSESLRLELKKSTSQVKVTTVEPSYIKTGMFGGVNAPVMTPLLEPDYIADKIIQAVKKNKIILREPFMVKLIPLLKGLLPAQAFDYLAGRLFGVYSSMDTFKGRGYD